MYYPKGYNPIHEVHSWGKVRGMVREIEAGNDVPAYLVDGENLLSGTHRAVANEILERRQRTPRRIETIELCDLHPVEQSVILALIEDNRYNDIQY